MVDANVDRYRRLLRSVRPEFAGGRFEFLGAGWDNVLFLVDGDRIARFAKEARTSRMLETEAALLAAIAPLLPVPVPQPQLVARTPAAPDVAVMIYHRVPGIPLDEVLPDEALVVGVAGDLARFLDALHAIPPGALGTIEIPTYKADGWVERHRTLYRRTRADVCLGLSAPAFNRFDAWWNDYLSDPASRTFEPCLVHGDLAPEHILVAPKQWRLSGIIDFGDAMWADPALDLAGWPESLAQGVAAKMRSLSPDRYFWTRCAAYRCIAPLHAVFAGRQNDRPDLLEDGIDALSRVFG